MNERVRSIDGMELTEQNWSTRRNNLFSTTATTINPKHNGLGFISFQSGEKASATTQSTIIF